MLWYAIDLQISPSRYCTIVRANKGLPVKVKAVPGEDEDDPVVYKEIVTDTSLACVVSKKGFELVSIP